MFDASDWAQEELAEADELGLIPEVLQGADLTQDITRAEFAAVAVKVYESLSSKAALPIAVRMVKNLDVLRNTLHTSQGRGSVPASYSRSQLLSR